MRFRTQLRLGIAALLATTLASAVMALLTLYATTQSAEVLSSKVVEELSRVHAVRLQTAQLISVSRGYLLTGDDRFEQRLITRKRQLTDAVDALRATQPDVRIVRRLSALEERAHAYSNAINDAARVRATTPSIVRLEQVFEDRVAPHRAELAKAVEQLLDEERAWLTTTSTRNARLVRASALTFLVGAGLAMATALALSTILVRRLNRQYREVQDARQAAKDAADDRKRLVDIVAHDLRSPLHTILLGLDLIKVERGHERYISTIAHATERMQRLVNDLLDAAREEASGLGLVRKECSVRTLLDLTEELFRDRVGQAGVGMRVECRADSIVVADRDRLLQVLANLVGNALTFSSRGNMIELHATAESDGVRFTVTDATRNPYRRGRTNLRTLSTGIGPTSGRSRPRPSSLQDDR